MCETHSCDVRAWTTPTLDEAHKKFKFVIVAYVVIILFGLLLPKPAIFLYFAVALFLIVPFRTVARAISGARSE